MHPVCTLLIDYEKRLADQTYAVCLSRSSKGRCRTPQSAHHPHKSHDEHRQCNPGGGIHFAVLLGSDNSYTTPLEIPFSSEVRRGGGIWLAVA